MKHPIADTEPEPLRFPAWLAGLVVIVLVLFAVYALWVTATDQASQLPAGHRVIEQKLPDAP